MERSISSDVHEWQLDRTNLPERKDRRVDRELEQNDVTRPPTIGAAARSRLRIEVEKDEDDAEGQGDDPFEVLLWRARSA